MNLSNYVKRNYAKSLKIQTENYSFDNWQVMFA